MWRVTFFGDEAEISDLICSVLDSAEVLPFHHAEIETPTGRAALLPVTSDGYKELLDSKENFG